MHIVRSLNEGSPAQGSSTQAQTNIGTNAALILASNPKRKGLIVQNTNTTTIKIVLGSTAPTQTVYHVALKGCAAADDGSGGAYFDDCWVGAVWAISSGASGTCAVTEITNNSPDYNLAADWGAASGPVQV